MSTTASPEAWSIPAETAIWCPKFRENEIIFTLSSSRASFRRMSSVPSRLPSFT